VAFRKGWLRKAGLRFPGEDPELAQKIEQFKLYVQRRAAASGGKP
jgi:hypothetical protein